MDTPESNGFNGQNDGCVGLLKKIRGVFSKPAMAPPQESAPTDVSVEAEPQMPEAQEVIAPGGYHVQGPSAPSSEDLGAMLGPVRDGLTLLPPLSQVVTELLREIEREKSSAATVGEIVSSDPALSAALIRAVNSAAFGLKRRLSSVNEAVSYLGLAIVKSMVIRLRLGEMLTSNDPQAAADIEDLWVHSLATSYAADCLARRVPGVDRGFVSTLGLLHDVGKLAVTAKLPGLACDIRERVAQNPTGDQRQIEAMVLGVDHASLGADLAERWKLPADLVQAIRWHHRPTDAIEASQALPLDKIVGVLKIANQLAKYCYPYCDRVQIDAVEDRTFDILGLEHSLRKLLDQPMQQAISKALFFVEDKCSLSTPRRFLRPLRGGAAMAAAMMGRPATCVSINEGVIQAVFANDAFRRKFRSMPGEVENCIRASIDDLKSMGLSATTCAAASMVVRSFLPNLLTINTPFDEVEFTQQQRGEQVVLGFRTPGLAAGRRAAGDISPEGTARLVEADFGNVVNLGWFSKIAISQSGDALILLSK
ncbi:MAG TPA: HDOD domain-containing protein [Tepidisphaeraceae bacterium]|nr:HDOD domain-containing protein [Tepidisphaeraceae bacterium]